MLEALEEQLFRYLTAHSTSAVLVALCPQRDFSAATLHVREWAAEASGFREATEGPVDGWIHHIYVVEGRNVEVCVATIAIPQVTTRDGIRK